MVGTGRSAKKGILIKDAKALEIAHKIKYIVFDKTGTLTKGHPEVKTFEVTSNQNADFIKKLIFSIEKFSHHPLAEAVTTFLNQADSFEITNFLDLPGFGISASADGRFVLIGSEKLMREKNIEIGTRFLDLAGSARTSAQTVSFVAVDGVVSAVIGIADPIKDDAIEIIKKLKEMNVVPIMLTGDNKNTARAIADQLGIDQVVSEVLPGDKAQKVAELQKLGIVAMVGDGINDAPALVQADIGIAMGTGTDVAIESGDIVLVKGTLDKVVEAIITSRQTLTIIKENLFWAFGYNILSIPIAAGILYPQFGILLSPAIASAAMAISSVSVVGNSLRLKFSRN